METRESVLRVEGLSKHFGGVKAVSNVSFEIAAERIVGIIGPNGSGKSTLFNLVSRVTPPTRGRIVLKGDDITRLRPDQVFRRGLSRTFQNTRLFPRLSVLENMLIGARARKLDVRAATEQLERVGLADLGNAPAGSLSYGDQKLLELAMTLVGAPAIALLDEPLAGVHEDVVARIRDVVLAESETTLFVMVEHNVSFMMQLCERIIVLNQGELLADATPREVRANEAVINAYLGKDAPAISETVN